MLTYTCTVCGYTRQAKEKPKDWICSDACRAALQANVQENSKYNLHDHARKRDRQLRSRDRLRRTARQ